MSRGKSFFIPYVSGKINKRNYLHLLRIPTPGQSLCVSCCTIISWKESYSPGNLMDWVVNKRQMSRDGDQGRMRSQCLSGHKRFIMYWQAPCVKFFEFRNSEKFWGLKKLFFQLFPPNKCQNSSRYKSGMESGNCMALLGFTLAGVHMRSVSPDVWCITGISSCGWISGLWDHLSKVLGLFHKCHQFAITGWPMEQSSWSGSENACSGLTLSIAQSCLGRNTCNNCSHVHVQHTNHPHLHLHLLMSNISITQ